MNTIKYYFNKLVTFISVLLLFFGVITICSIFTTPLEMNILSYILTVIIGVISLLLGGGGLFLQYSLPKRCPQCKRWFAIQKKDTILDQSKKVYVVVENKTRSAYSGKVMETSEQHIPGKRNTYKTTYVCKYCGAEIYKYKTVDTPNI